MVIDIDSFLEKYNKESQGEKKNFIDKIDLDFQKDIEDKIFKTEVKIKQDTRFELLETVYNEIKIFEEDLPNKFLSIENKSNNALKSIGNKYSDEFLLRVKANVNVIKLNIEEHLKILDSKLYTEDFVTIVKEFDLILKYYEVFPKEFLEEKIKFSNEIRKREILINQKINEFKLVKLKTIKININNSILNLNKSLRPNNIAQIEDNLEILHRLYKSIPKIFLTEYTNEKILISKVLINAENYLANEYTILFNNNVEIINILMEKFHSAYINKDLDKALLLYDEILLEFQNLPEVFFERKIEMYKKTNDLYTNINDLFLKNNLSILMQSYNSSQIFKEANDYIKYIKSTSKLNFETLLNYIIK